MRRSPAYIETPQIRLPPAVNISHQNIRGVHSEHTQNFIYPSLKCKWPIHTKLLAPNDLISLSYRTQYCVWNDNVYYELKKKIDWNILVLPDQCSRTFWASSRYRYRDTICRSHARAPTPMQTNTLGTSRCTDRYIRDMQTSAPNNLIEILHPNAIKWAHIPFPVNVIWSLVSLTEKMLFTTDTFLWFGIRTPEQPWSTSSHQAARDRRIYFFQTLTGWNCSTQATGLDARTPRIECTAQFISHFYGKVFVKHIIKCHYVSLFTFLLLTIAYHISFNSLALFTNMVELKSQWNVGRNYLFIPKFPPLHRRYFG